MVQPFDGLAVALANLLGSTPEAAGLLLGFVTVIALALAFILVLDKEEMGVGYISAGTGVAFVVAVGWWYNWMIVFIALIVIFAIINPFEKD